jgi:hypothetical protein
VIAFHSAIRNPNSGQWVNLDLSVEEIDNLTTAGRRRTPQETQEEMILISCGVLRRPLW